LVIDPCIPSDWDGFQVKRRYFGDVYNITVRNPQHVEKGVKQIKLDDVALEKNIIKPIKDGKTHKVEVIMG